MSTFYFYLSLFSLIAAVSALVRLRKLFFLAPVYFMMAWLTGELALIHMVWQMALSGLLIAAGVLDTELGQWALILFVNTWLLQWRFHKGAMTNTPAVYQRELQSALGEDFKEHIPPDRRALLRDGIERAEWVRPFSMSRPGVNLSSDISYGDGGDRNLLDVYQPDQPREGGAPVLLQVHGGGWMIGNKREQALPLINHLCSRGWVCVSINYRLSPKHAMPAHIIDVKKAIAWVRDNIEQYGGDPRFLAITGGSAGGHLSSHAALTGNDPQWQPGFEQADTSIQAAVPFYGIYDFLDREGVRGSMSMEKFLAKNIFQCEREDDPDLWEQCCTISHVGEHAPPMFMVHGTHDSLAWNEDAQHFVTKLREVARNPVLFAELRGAQHAFEMFHSPRTEFTLNAVMEFLEWAHADWLSGQP